MHLNGSPFPQFTITAPAMFGRLGQTLWGDKRLAMGWLKPCHGPLLPSRLRFGDPCSSLLEMSTGDGQHQSHCLLRLAHIICANPKCAIKNLWHLVHREGSTGGCACPQHSSGLHAMVTVTGHGIVMPCYGIVSGKLFSTTVQTWGKDHHSISTGLFGI